MFGGNVLFSFPDLTSRTADPAMSATNNDTSVTNLRGHVIKASYSPYDSMAFSVTYYNAKLIDPDPTGSRTSIGHLLVDVMWKF